MSGILTKFARGALSGGLPLLADNIREEKRAEIMANRDAILRSFQTEDREDQQKFQAEQSELDRTARANSKQERLAGVQLSEAETMQELNQQYDTADEAGRIEIAKKILQRQGKPVEGEIITGNRYMGAGSMIFDKSIGDFLPKPKDQSELLKLAATVAKDVFSSQAANRKEPGDAGYRDYKTILDQTVADLSAAEATLTPPPPAAPKPVAPPAGLPPASDHPGKVIKTADGRVLKSINGAWVANQ